MHCRKTCASWASLSVTRWTSSTMNRITVCLFRPAYVIDTSGIIRAADVNADYTIRPEPSDTVKFLRTLKP